MVEFEVSWESGSWNAEGVLMKISNESAHRVHLVVYNHSTFESLKYAKLEKATEPRNELKKATKFKTEIKSKTTMTVKLRSITKWSL